MESNIPADAEHEVLSTASSFLSGPVLIGAAAGAVLGKSAGWAVAGGVAGWLYQNARAPQTQAPTQAVNGCLGCGDFGLPSRPMLQSREIRQVSVVPTAASEAAEDAIEATHEAAAAGVVAGAGVVAAPEEKKSILPLLILAGGAWWLLG